MLTLLIILLLAFAPLHATEEFSVKASSDANGIVTVELVAPPEGYVAMENLTLTGPDTVKITCIDKGTPAAHAGYANGVYRHGARLIYQTLPPTPLSSLKVLLQGCVGDLCFMPQEIELGDTAKSAPSALPDTPGDVAALLAQFQPPAYLTGYHPTRDFLAFLSSDGTATENWLQRLFQRHGFWLAALAILPLGFLLNLTPCILPMIPITLGILGAGAKNAPKRGWMLGASYGGAMALSYGLLGVLCVALGGQFGAINSSWIFNGVIGVIFLVLAAAMMDWLTLDLSRFQVNSRFSRRGTLAGALLLGAMSALLASACIAPVLVWVLLLSTQIYQEGNWLGLWLPMLLGFGLGAPWPFLGAGIAHLPKPGPWMIRIKHLFAIIIAIAALYFFHCAWTLGKPTPHRDAAISLWRNDISAALRDAAKNKRVLLVDVWGVSCKACTMMDHTTLQNKDVIRMMREMLLLKVQADRKNHPETTALLKQLHIVGMPTYIRLVPKP